LALAIGDKQPRKTPVS